MSNLRPRNSSFRNDHPDTTEDRMPYRFVHAADIHLDSPLQSLVLHNPSLASLIDQLAGMTVRTLCEIEGWRTAIQHSEYGIEHVQAEIDRLTMEYARHEAKRTAMDGVGVPCEPARSRSRSCARQGIRSALWSTPRSGWSNGSSPGSTATAVWLRMSKPRSPRRKLSFRPLPPFCCCSEWLVDEPFRDRLLGPVSA